MLLKKGSLVILSVIILIMSFPSAVFSRSAADGARAGRALALQELSDSIEGVAEKPPRVSRTKEGYLRFIMSPPSTHFAAAPAARATPQESAAVFLERWRNLFFNESRAIGFDTIRVKTSGSRTYVRLQQRYAGLEVLGAQMIVQVNQAGGVVAVLSDVMRDTESLDAFEISLDPTINALTAQDVAVEWLAEQYEGLRFEASPAALMIFSPSVVGRTGPARLVWQTEVSSIDGSPIEEFVCVDAHSGEIAFHYSLVYDAIDREIYDSNNTTADPGTLVGDENSPPSGPADANAAYDYLGDAYDFYNDEHGRDSIDANGMALKGTVRYCFSSTSCPMAMAYWHPTNKAMYFGDGWVADDIVGHEFTHGVTQHESNLDHSDESGAINESLSDMWGEWIDQVNGDGNDAEAAKWLFGEDRPGGVKRDMADPPQYSTWYGGPMPDRYNSPYWYDGSSDYGGVHHNIGVGNKLCYLLTDGDTFNDYTISGLDIAKTADLFYECQVNLLTSSSDYYGLGDALELAASNLGFTQSERDNVGAACRAVEIIATPTRPVAHDSIVSTKINTPFGIFLEATDDGLPASPGVMTYSITSLASHGDLSDPGAGAISSVPYTLTGNSNRVIYTPDTGYLGSDSFDFDANDGGLYPEGGASPDATVTVNVFELVHWWKLDETSGTTAEDSIESNDGTVYGAQWTTGGQIDGGLYFDDTDDYVDLGPLEALKGQTATISAWAKAVDASDECDPLVVQCYIEGDKAYGYSLYLLSGKPYFSLSDAYTGDEGDAIGSNEWHHFAGTYDGMELRVYLDGALKDSTPYADGTGYDTNAYLGAFDYEGCNFGGIIDDVRVYNPVVDVGEIWDMAFYGTSKFTISNEVGGRMAWFDDLGNLFLKGSLTQNTTPTATANDEFRVQDSAGNDVAIIDATNGNMCLDGSVQTTWSDPAGGVDEFIIRSGEGDAVAYIDELGNLYLLGSVYEAGL